MNVRLGRKFVVPIQWVTTRFKHAVRTNAGRDNQFQEAMLPHLFHSKTKTQSAGTIVIGADFHFLTRPSSSCARVRARFGLCLVCAYALVKAVFFFAHNIFLATLRVVNNSQDGVGIPQLVIELSCILMFVAPMFAYGVSTCGMAHA